MFVRRGGGDFLQRSLTDQTQPSSKLSFYLVWIHSPRCFIREIKNFEDPVSFDVSITDSKLKIEQQNVDSFLQWRSLSCK